ncbi:MAG: replication initiator protein A [Bryobacteraceae bacterium]
MGPKTPNPDDQLVQAKHGGGDLFICDVADAVLKDLIPQMEHPFYSLSKKPETAIRRYEHNGNWLQIVPSVKGLATIYDKDILIYCISQLMEKLKRNEQVGPRLRITSYACSSSPTGLTGFRRDELQDLLDAKAKALSFSVVDHLRWDLKQIFDMAVAEGLVSRNPALLLFTPKEAAKRERRVMNGKEVQTCFAVLDRRERLIAKLAVLAGMRPGEIFALRWGQLTATYADIRQRVYRGTLDTPKTDQSTRKAALSQGLLAEIEAWRAFALSTDADAFVFPSEKLTPLSRDNCWRRNMLPKLEAAGLGWANFQVMRRTHATLMKAVGAEGKLVADQMGHSLDVNQNVYTQSPVESRLGLVNKLEESLRVQ